METTARHFFPDVRDVFDSNVGVDEETVSVDGAEKHDGSDEAENMSVDSAEKEESVAAADNNNSDTDESPKQRFPIKFVEWTSVLGPSGISFAEEYVTSVEKMQLACEIFSFQPYDLSQVAKSYSALGYFVIPKSITIWQWQVQLLLSELKRRWSRQARNPYDLRCLQIDAWHR